MEKPVGYIDLNTLIKQRGVLDEPFARQVIRNLLAAIEYCHSMGVLHRDIKSYNILVHPENAGIKLIDFGCATLFSHDKYFVFSGIYTYIQ